MERSPQNGPENMGPRLQSSGPIAVAKLGNDLSFRDRVSEQIDFRSDFVTRPTPAMIAAMVEAAGQAPAFGLTDDPMVRQLEEDAAAKLGKDAALFCPTCTMCNQIAIYLQCERGETVLAESNSHIFLGESGSLAALAGAMALPVPGVRGAMDEGELRSLLRKREIQRSRSALVVLENTHANLGGLVIPLDHCQAISDLAHEWGVPVHLDGSRVFNASTRLGCSPASVADCADSVSISLNKGLGAPMGAILAGTRTFIDQAAHVRQLFGGGWRPAGILAAAGVVALATMIERLEDDHRSAKSLGEKLHRLAGIEVRLADVETNILMADVAGSQCPAREFTDRLGKLDILALPASSGPASVIRFVTHHGVSAADVDTAAAAVAEVLTSFS